MAPRTQHAEDPAAEPPAVLYVGRVMHRRLRPFGHRFSYRVFSMLIDIDRIAEAASGSRIFSYNRFNLFGYDDRDHGPRRRSDPGRSDPGRSDPAVPSLRHWVEQQLADAGIEIGGGRIRLLCFPRVLGYVFNPLSIFFCHRHDGELAAILYEVHNTFGESHVYAFRVDSAGPVPSKADRTGGSRPAVLAHAADKAFHVSPFIDMTPRYRFRLRPPGERLSILIRETDAKGDLLLATLHGTAAPFDNKTLARLFFTHPLMSLKVIAAIHWQALKLWSKGARYHPRPRSKADEHPQT